MAEIFCTEKPRQETPDGVRLCMNSGLHLTFALQLFNDFLQQAGLLGQAL